MFLELTSYDLFGMAQGNFKKSGGSLQMKGKAGKASVAAKSRRNVNKGKTAVKKGCKWSRIKTTDTSVKRVG